MRFGGLMPTFPSLSRYRPESFFKVKLVPMCLQDLFDALVISAAETPFSEVSVISTRHSEIVMPNLVSISP